MPLAVVHLTWTGKAESDPRWPSTSTYRSWQGFVERCLIPESQTFALDDSKPAVGFHAQQVVVTDEESYLLIGFADDHNDTHEYLRFQRAHEYDEQDIRLGMNDVYIEYMDQSRSAYGGIARIELHRDRLALALDRNTAAKLGVDGELEIIFGLDGERFNELRVGLTRVFQGHPCYIDAA